MCSITNYCLPSVDIHIKRIKYAHARTPSYGHDLVDEQKDMLMIGLVTTLTATQLI